MRYLLIFLLIVSVNVKEEPVIRELSHLVITSSLNQGNGHQKGGSYKRKVVIYSQGGNQEGKRH